MIASRTTRFPNVVALSGLLVLVVLATGALLPFVQMARQTTTRAEPIAVPFPYYRLNEFHAYRLSEWGVDVSPAPVQAPWFDLSRLPASYVRSEKGGPASHPALLDMYTQLMAVK
jgi:hypothetical protein